MDMSSKTAMKKALEIIGVVIPYNGETVRFSLDTSERPKVIIEINISEEDREKLLELLYPRIMGVANIIVWNHDGSEG